MKKKLISVIVGLSMLAPLCGVMSVQVSADDVVYKKTARMMEELNRGLIAVKTTEGVYLSWRVFGKEDLATTAYDIYRKGLTTPIATIAGGQANNYTDKNGLETNEYKVVVSGATAEQIEDEPWVTPQQTKGDATWTYFDVPIVKPTDIAHANTTAKSDYTRTNKVGGPNDASLGDLDGDGDYEIVLKWDPKNSKDSASSNITGHCVFDAYEIDPNNGGFMWRIDIGNNIAAGAHYSQFMVYDFDNDGKAEIATLTAPGSYSLVKNASGGYDKIYVTSVGDTPKIQNADNNATTLRKGNNNGPEYYTIFDGETGRPLRTTDAIPIGPLNEKGEVDSTYENGSYWGDSSMNRSERYLAAVAYLDGVNPYYVPIRGMYNRTIIRAYTWDGENLTLVKEHNGDKKGSTMYGEGNHNLSVADIDNDGKDEIVYGSACLDDDFKTILGNTKMGHGDAMHVSDFNNDGTIEVFSVKEDSEGNSRAADFRVAKTGNAIWKLTKSSSQDNGRGVMDNIDDAYASTHSDALALGWDALHDGAYDFKGNAVAAKPTGNSRNFCNFLVYWDDDLGRELLDDNQMAKYHADTGVTDRMFFNGQGYLPGTSNNSTKATPSLVADLWGDWREEVIMPAENDTVLRIMTPIKPTKYRLATLMHDSQYRLSIAWQNVSYNQPPHTSYYIGSAALAKDADGNTLNYLSPATPFDKIMYPSDIPDVPITGIDMKHDGAAMTSDPISLERGKTYKIDAAVEPSDVRKKTIRWTTSDPTVAVVSNGTITAVGEDGTSATITATSVGNSDVYREITVNVWSRPVTGIEITDPSETVQSLTPGDVRTLTAVVTPSNASEKGIKWSSSNPSVATVDSNGTVTAVSMGLATVYARTVDGDFKDVVVINVLPPAVEDVAGDGVFETTNTLDDKVKFTGSRDGAALTLAEATVPVEFHKDFEPFNDNTVTLSFHFTTGGAKTTDYIWKLGHTYNTELKLLDTDGNNIFNIVEEHTTSSNTTKYAVGSGNRQNVSGAWTKLSDGDDGPWNRSQIRWDIKVTLDYGTDTGTINLAGCNNAWVRGETWQTTFPLNGASFKTLKYETNTIADWVSGSPKLENCSYEKTIPATDGASNSLYRRGEKKGVAWSEYDIAGATGGFVPTDQTNYPLMYDEANKRIWFNPTKPAASYSATKEFSVDDDALVEYDLDWHFGSAVGANREHSEYVQIGDSIRFGWKTDYKVYLSKDGGANWEKSVFDGSNASFTKNVHLTYDKQTNTVKSLTFDGKTVMANEPLNDPMNKVTFGFDRQGSTSDWGYPCGLENISVSQFVPGAEAKFKVTYLNVDGTVLDEQEVAVGGSAQTIADPTKGADDKYGSYVFAGWSPNPATEVIVDETVFEAQYNTSDPRSYNVTLNVNGGTLADEDNVTSYTYGTPMPLPGSDVITKTGHAFDGWYEDEACEGAEVIEITNTTGNKTYYAKWTPETYMVELYLNGGSVANGEIVTEYTYGTAKTLPTLTRAGHSFDGWYDNEEYEGDGVTAISATDIGDKAYYAKFIPGVYAIKWHTFGANVGDVPTEYTYGTDVTLPTPTKDGCTFDGWYSNATYRTKVTKIFATDTGDKNIYAKWKVNSNFIEVGAVSEDGKTVSAYFALPDKTNVIIAALYDGSELKELKSGVASAATNFESGVIYSKDFSFENNVNDYTLKLFVWDSLGTMQPIVEIPNVKDKVNN